MVLTRRVMAILAVVAALSLLGGAPATADTCTAGCRDRLVEMGVEGRVVQLVAHDDGTCALTERGEVVCWGARYPAPYRPWRSSLVLVTIGALLVAGGTTLLTVSRR